ncbi:hypothetical protein IF2G_06948 [Cordyceps javanica]|nr:hypothetical protein IF2G_06948 [Cordyceps javanica]
MVRVYGSQRVGNSRDLIMFGSVLLRLLEICYNFVGTLHFRKSAIQEKENNATSFTNTLHQLWTISRPISPIVVLYSFACW